MFSPAIRPWPHRFGCLPGYERLLSKFDGAAPQNLYSDILSWEGFGHELRMIRDKNPHELMERISLPDNEGDDWLSYSDSARFDFLGTEEKLLNTKILKSAKVQISFVIQHPSFSIGYIQNNFAHRLYYVLQGSVIFFTPLGILSVPSGSYAFVPKGLVYTWKAYGEDARLLSIESRDILFSPLLPACGMFFPFDFAALSLPEQRFEDDVYRNRNEYIVLEKDNFEKSFVKRLKNHPLRILAWSGFLYPFKLELSHIKTISSHNFHLSPDALTTFVTENGGLKIATFQPRILHSLPFSHRNVDYDEFLLYLSSYSARKVEAGQATFHPRGFHHGPEEKVYDARPDLKSGVVDSLENRWTEEKAIMIESRELMLVNKRALHLFSEP